MPEVHARLSASSAKRWLTCPPIIALEELSGIKDRSSSYAEEGTEAHSLSELKLRRYLAKPKEARKIDLEIEAFKKSASWYDQEMEEATELYVDYVEEIYNSHSDLAQMELEQQVQFDKWVPGGFGTSDVVITSPEVIEIIDLKYGKGIKVEAYQNPQLMLYALGAFEKYDWLYDFERVRMTIVQPRLDWMDTFEVATEELLYWANNYVAPRAALADQGIGEWNITEDVMRFSKVRGRLRPEYEANKDFIERYEYQEGALLEPEDLSEVLAQADQIKRWLMDVESFALQSILDGGEVPGFKVVAGRSVRKISDPVELAKRLEDAGFDEKAIFKAPQLETLGNLEKLVGKKEFESLSEGTIIKPEGKPTLAPESDKRPAINSTQDAIEDFKDL